jgi:hypothetical protein
MSQKLTDKDLIAIIRAHRRDSLGVEDGELSNDRATALDHYHGRPYGNEVDGRSQVVSRDFSEAVDWAMPSILRAFVQSGSLGEFDPVGPEDEDLAAQESDYVNQVIMKDNSGFMVLHDVFKDTLMLKNGYAKHQWDKSEKITDEEYTGLTLDEITRMLGELEASGAEVKIKGQESRIVMGGMQPIEVFDIKLQIKRVSGKVIIDAVPVEEVRVSKRCRGSLQTSPFTEHVTRKTRSELIEMGMQADFVNDLPAWNERVSSTEATSRDSVADESTYQGSAVSDKSMDEIEYCEAYLKVDWDGDGIAELRKVVTVANKLPEGEEWNEPIEAVPMTGFIAKRMPHRHVGESLDDELADLQEIKTVLFRQLLDNIYATNNSQWLVNERVNLEDFMQSLPGGIKRVTGMDPVNGSVEAVQAQPIVAQILPVVDYVDNIKSSRTGISPGTDIDPNVLQNTTKGAFIENLNKANQKIEMLTRMLAESGVKELFMQVHGLLIRHQDKARVVKMRGRWVSINPQEWKERTDLTVKVGLGTGSEEQKLQKLTLLSSAQEKIAQLGLVGPAQGYALFEDVVQVLGFDMPGKYAMAPDSPEFQKAQEGKPQTNPLIEVEKIKLQGKAQELQLKAQQAGQKAQFDMQQEQLRSSNDITIEREKIAAQIELERWKAQLKADTDIRIAEIQASMNANQINPMMGGM